MKKIFITGISGTGKTTIAHLLNAKGIHAISIDEVLGLCVWKNKISGKLVDYEAELNEFFITTHDWICDVDMLTRLLNETIETIVVLGIAANQDSFLHLFDKTLLLQCRPETFIKRILERKDNDFGKDETAQKLLLASYKKFETDLLGKGAISIDAEQPVEDVAQTIVSLIYKLA